MAIRSSKLDSWNRLERLVLAIYVYARSVEYSHGVIGVTTADGEPHATRTEFRA